MNNTATFIMNLRKITGMTQASMAKYLNVSQGTVSKIESGKKDISLFQYMKLCDEFDLQYDSISTIGLNTWCFLRGEDCLT